MSTILAAAAATADRIADKWVGRLGLGFHPDTRGADYVGPDGKQLLTPQMAVAYERDMNRLPDPYAAGMRAWRRAGLVAAEVDDGSFGLSLWQWGCLVETLVNQKSKRLARTAAAQALRKARRAGRTCTIIERGTAWYINDGFDDVEDAPPLPADCGELCLSGQDGDAQKWANTWGGTNQKAAAA